jgi:hypothetical protein
LREDVDAAQIGVEAVGEGDVDDAVHATKRDGRLGTVASEGIEALTGSAGEKDSESVFHRTSSNFGRGPVRLFGATERVDGSTGPRVAGEFADG